MFCPNGLRHLDFREGAAHALRFCCREYCREDHGLRASYYGLRAAFPNSTHVQSKGSLLVVRVTRCTKTVPAVLRSLLAFDQPPSAQCQCQCQCLPFLYLHRCRYRNSSGVFRFFLTPFNLTPRWVYMYIYMPNPLPSTRVHEIPTYFFLRLLSRHFYPRVAVVPTIRTIFSLTRLVVVDT
jgi:hypothetical protein